MDFVSLLKHCDLKVTPQRLTLLEQIHSHGHVDIDTLFENIKKSFPTISLATLYKNINAMVEKDLLKEVKIVGMKNKYELTKKEHAHAICNSCGKVEDVYLDTDSLKDNLETSTQYYISQTDMNFFGVCPKCKAS
eukprot:Anaeramoba_flamelloidesa92805_30.p1 GENE.a92805_30~~a92805_30.p1  ORF type:complete len:135 (-),score=0.48 a92805_30:41-445(-)